MNKQIRKLSSIEEINYDVLPCEKLKVLSKELNVDLNSLDFAFKLDQEDPLKVYRNKFYIPKRKDLPFIDEKLLENNLEEECIYLCGQSLGLIPLEARENVNKVLDNWSNYTVHTHTEGYLPAALCDLPPKASMAKLVGAKESEIAIMNGLTVNLHILLSTFYRPSNKRNKILIEDHAFSSDMYVVQSQIKLHDLNVDECLITYEPRENEHIVREEDLMKLIDENKDTIALILLPGLHYYTGQWYDVSRLAKHAKQYDIVVGVDCAHAIGNKELKLDDWNIDFAAWCTYKYLCSGPGGIGCIYVNEKFTKKNNLNDKMPILRGWWGNNIETKFQMNKIFDPCEGADMFKLSNPPPLLVATLMASLKIFNEVGMKKINKKQYLITGYLEYLLEEAFVKEKQIINIITPKNPNQRGCQLSIIFNLSLKDVQKKLDERGIVCDIRMPNVMRITPCPLYTSYKDVYNFVETLKQILNE